MGGAGVPEPSGKGKKKSLDAVINVVPFIDLLSCCLAFLLITAVWTQLGKLQVSQAGGVPAPGVQPPKLALALSVTGKGYALTVGQDGAATDIAKKGAEYDVPTLVERLKDIRLKFPDQREITVQSEDAIEYSDLVGAIDACIKTGLDTVSVQPI
jgi:biopolymer transport protein TolR